MRERQRAGNSEAEAQALKNALSLAVADLAGLIERVEGEAQDMLAFQLAMLEDDALRPRPWRRSRRARRCAHGLGGAMDGEIAGYEASDDDYFRARAADLKDMRDRVLRHLNGDDEQQVAAGAVLAGEDIGPPPFWKPTGARAAPSR